MISSRKNTKITLFRTLLRDRNTRKSESLFVAEGAKLCEEALNCGLIPNSALFTGFAISKYSDLYKKISAHIIIDEINKDLSEYISDTISPQGIFVSFPLIEKSFDLKIIHEYNKLVILDRLQDPGNLGTIIRTCDAFGIDGLLIGESSVDVNSPKVLRSAAGSAFRLPIFKINIFETVTELKKMFSVFAAVLGEGSKNLNTLKFPVKSAIIIGNEGAGISREIIEICNEKLYIPIKNAESLNAAIAASILIYEMNKETF